MEENLEENFNLDKFIQSLKIKFYQYKLIKMLFTIND